MPRLPTPLVAQPALEAYDILGIILQCSNRSCCRQAWFDATIVVGRTVPELQSQARWSHCDQRGALVEAKRLIEAWRRDYNESRPHMAHNGQSPGEFVRNAGLCHGGKVEIAAGF